MTVFWLDGCSQRSMSTLPSVNQSQPGNGSPQPLTLRKAIDLLHAAKLASNRRPVYVNALVRTLKQSIKGFEDNPVSCFDAAKIETYLTRHKFCPITRRSVINRLSSFFSFAKKRKWIAANPVEEIERPILEWKAPCIFTPEQVERLFRSCQILWPDRLAFVTLCCFGGLRPTEAMQISKEYIDLENGTIRVEAGVSKIRQRRIVHLHPTAVLWLKHCLKDSRLPIPDGARRWWMKDFARALGLKTWLQDGLRHTCASMWLAEKQDSGFVSMQLGNSQQILFRHYINLSTKEVAEKFWSIKP
jgi:integrase